jgi:hypothetical protein
VREREREKEKRKKNLLETPKVGFANEFDYLLGIFRRRIIECETLIILIPLKVAGRCRVSIGKHPEP